MYHMHVQARSLFVCVANLSCSQEVSKAPLTGCRPVTGSRPDRLSQPAELLRKLTTQQYRR